jgi:hypothetical protein
MAKYEHKTTEAQRVANRRYRKSLKGKEMMCRSNARRKHKIEADPLKLEQRRERQREYKRNRYIPHPVKTYEQGIKDFGERLEKPCGHVVASHLQPLLICETCYRAIQAELLGEIKP